MSGPGRKVERETEQRLKGCDEVTRSFDEGQARIEALRCLLCKDPTCVGACPLQIDIKAFIGLMADGEYDRALEKIMERNPLPAVCGRVCQYELYCEKECKLGKKLPRVAIGALERFAADHGTRREAPAVHAPRDGAPLIAIAGSGPAGLIAAYDLVRLGYRVRVFEALHEFGGVLRYGIPAFRLPREVIDREIERLRQMGVEFVNNFIVGRTCTLEELFEEGYAATFVATGAGVPHFMNIPGENLIGVYTANEFLTRVNLMGAYRFPESHTPIRVGQKAVIVGGGNAAMDAARWARRFGCETTVLFRRGRKEPR
ncbi:MAG: FAD-dependent oxidoreductase, partial [Acidobacteria bacterium]|nr:FAD-dependent oxidoreductase [Acidobacteriota bacterium]